MADRDWDKELAKVDKQLASLSDEALIGPPPVPASRGGAKASAPAPAGRVAAPAMEKPTKAWAVYLRLTLSVALGVGMVLWPYPSRCGVGLAGYLAAVGAVIASGIWSSVWTWRHRAARAHTLSLLIVLWGLVLGAMEILPRVGYGKADDRHPSGWVCQDVATPTPPAPTTPTPTKPVVP